MRFSTTQISLILIFISAFFTPAFAVISTPKTASVVTLKQQSTSSHAVHAQKKTFSIQKMLKKRGIDFSHPTDKWLWFGLVLLGLAVIMSILPVIRLLAGLVSLVGVVFIFIWLFKKLA